MIRSAIVLTLALLVGCAEPAPSDPDPQPPAPEPTAQEPSAEPAVAQEPTAQEPAAEEPASEEPASEEPASEEPVAEEPADAPAAEPPAEPTQATEAAPAKTKRACTRLDTALRELQAASDLDAVAHKHGLAIVQGRVRVIVEPNGDIPPFQGPITEELRGTAGIQVLVPPRSLCALAGREDVTRVRAPRRASPRPGVQPRTTITTNKPKKPTAD